MKKNIKKNVESSLGVIEIVAMHCTRIHFIYCTVFSIFQYQLVTFNDMGPDITRNVEVREPTEDLNRFKQEILGLEFESFDGGRDSKERLLQGLLVSIFRFIKKSLLPEVENNLKFPLHMECLVLF